MKNLMTKFVITAAILTLGFVSDARAQDGVAITPDSEAAEGLDLYAVAELFKDCENLAKFEQSLNDPEVGINNLDLNENGEVDFIRVTERVSGDTHLIILQTPLGQNEFQDVATIAVEKEGGEKYTLQLQGDSVIYGPNSYVIPANNNFSTWNVLRWLFSPNYRVYISPFSYGTYPSWWSVRRPVTVGVYRGRTGFFVGRKNFVAAKTIRVTTIAKFNYHPRTSPLVTKKVRVVHTTTVARPANGGKTAVKKTTTHVVKIKKGKP